MHVHKYIVYNCKYICYYVYKRLCGGLRLLLTLVRDMCSVYVGPLHTKKTKKKCWNWNDAYIY